MICNYLNRGIILSLALTFSANVCINAQNVHLGMTKDSLVMVFGNPDMIIPLRTDFVKYGETYIYGTDSFQFSEPDNTIMAMNISSPAFILNQFTDCPVQVGTNVASLLLGTDHNYFLFTSNDFFQYYVCPVYDDGTVILVQAADGIIKSVKVLNEPGKFKYGKTEFREFFEASFKASDTPPDNPLWPSTLYPDWDNVSIKEALDGSSATICVPFLGKLIPTASYSGKNCPAVVGRLVITKILDDSSRFKQSIISLVPKPGLVPGDAFSGLLVYSNVNSGTAFAWELYEKGHLLYSRFPSSSTEVQVSDAVNKLRPEALLLYSGGEEGISDDDWATVAANRINVTRMFDKALSAGWTEPKLLAEKRLYSFASSLNKSYTERDVATVSPYDNPATADEVTVNPIETVGTVEPVGTVATADEGTAKSDETVATADEGTAKSDETVAAADDDSPLPAYYGKSHNLNSLLTLQLSPIEMSYDYRDNTLENRTEAILICKNSDYCDYTIKMTNNSLYRVHEGENIIEGVKGAFRYRYYRGNTVGRIDVKYPYVMPVAPGTKVRFINEQREYHRSFVVLVDTGESLHAMRAGRVCLTDDERCILVYHKDGSFAAYMNVEDRCVYPGDSVEPGDPIGKCGAGKMSISLFYLDKNKINDNAWSYTHFTPYFRTAEADVKLETDVEYVSFIDDDIITREMSRLRKKIYLHGRD